ncbi:MAG TPA: BTAD domain-containing putative transcriptional regulator, partial [Steroidobacteraceae bacterium]|nr:BTAD domain-containing putative transcriptional regulator [Steroidobacteraceae bacterium]
ELLTAFRVFVAGRPVPNESWHQRKPAALVKLLALAPRHRLHREQAMDALWPDLEPAAAAANLRKALHHARRALDQDHGAALLLSVGEILQLGDDGALTVDVDSFRATLSRARATGDPAAYWEAVNLYGQGLLPDDTYESWAGDACDDLQRDAVQALEELAGILEAAGDLDGAVRAVSRLVAADRLDEEAHARLIRLHALAGRRTEALRQYEHLRALLDAELGAEPSPETQRLVEEIRARAAAEPELTAELWERVGELRVVSGDTRGAVKAFSAALDIGVAPDDAARLHRRLADAWLIQFDGEHAAPHLNAAEDLAKDASERCRLLRLRATEAWQRGDLDVAARLAEETLNAARALHSSDDLAAAQETVAIVSHMRGDWRAGLLSGLDALAGDGEHAEQLGRVFEIHHCIGEYHLYGDGLSADVEEYARRVLTAAERGHAVRAQAFAWCLLGESLLLQARWDEAAGCLTRSCELHATLGSRSGALPWQRLAELAVCTGSIADVEPALRQASAIATVSPMALHLWGRIHATAALSALAQQAPDAAARHVRAAAAAAARYGDCPSCSALLNPTAAEALAQLGDSEAASHYASAAARVADGFGSSAWRAMAESAAGSVAHGAGDVTQAAAHFGSAAALYEQAGHPFWAARSATAAAEVARERSGNGTVLVSAQVPAQ